MPDALDEDDVPPWESLSTERPTARPVAPPAAAPVPAVRAIPIREQAGSDRLEQRREPGEAPALKEPTWTPEGDAWAETVQRLLQAESITALVRELALQSQLVARDGERWVLRVEGESLIQSNAPDRLAAALATLGHTVKVVIEMGTVRDSVALRQAALEAQKQREAEALIMADPFVQSMMRDFGGKIVPGTLKAIG